MGEYAVAKTSVWWDIENCAVPRSCDPQLIVQNMSAALATAGYRGAISVSAYGDTHQIAHHVQHALSSTGVSLNHVPAGIKDASDKKILVDMLFWAIDNPPPANYLLISGDRDFSNAIHKLKMRRYNILLAQPQNVSQTLTAAAKSVWLWKSLVAGEPPLPESPYISSTSSGNKDEDNSKNIVSSSSAVTRDTNPQKRSNPEDSEFTKQTSFKKSKGDFHSTEQCTLNQPKIGQLKAVRGQGMICFKCGDGHIAAHCTFNGDCHTCGRPGHKGRVCKENPNSIVKWIPAHAHDLATSLPGSVQITSPASQLHPTCSSPSVCSQQATPGVVSPSPAPPMAPALPQKGDGLSSGPAPAMAHAYNLAMFSQGLIHMIARASQLRPTWTPSQGSLWQATPAVPFPSLAPAPPHTCVAASSAPAQSGGNATLTAASLRKPDVVRQPTSSAPRPPTEVQAYQPVLGQYHQVGTSQLLPAWTPPPGYLWRAAPVVPSPCPVPLAAPVPGVAASPRPSHSGFSPFPSPSAGHGKYTPS